MAITETGSRWRTRVDTLHRQHLYPFITKGSEEDREVAHERAVKMMEGLQNLPLALAVMRKLFTYNDPTLETKAAGIPFRNPLGVAAGLDKEFRIHPFLGEGQGFGYVTGGSVTAIPYEGNPRPRIFQLPDDDGYINRMGFPGDGVSFAEKRLMGGVPRNYVLLGSVGASLPSFKEGKALQDYDTTARRIAPHVDALEYNWSSPNTEGVRAQQTVEYLDEASKQAVKLRKETKKPFWYKFGPDLDDDTLGQLVELAVKYKVDGITVTNTTTDPEIRRKVQSFHREQMGGISGRPLTEKALHKSVVVFEASKGEIAIKRAGGIMTPKDMWDAMTEGGADLVDVYTGYVGEKTSTPNFSWYMLTALRAAMNDYGIKDVQALKQLKGQKVPYPLAA